MINNSKIHTLLYLLMRDHLPTGIIAETIKTVNQAHTPQPQYTNPHLLELAKDYTKRLEEESNTEKN